MKSLIEAVNEFCDAHIAPPEVDAPPTAAELLRRAAYRVGQPGAWCQYYVARLKDGRMTHAASLDADAYCMLGALYAEREAAGGAREATQEAYSAIERAVGTSLIAEWNDAPTRTQDQVVAALIKASEIAETL